MDKCTLKTMLKKCLGVREGENCNGENEEITARENEEL